MHLSYAERLATRDGVKCRRFITHRDKTWRTGPFAAQCEHGMVKMVEAPWNKAYVDELAFPNGAHDDQVDDSCAAFRRLAGRSSYGLGLLAA